MKAIYFTLRGEMGGIQVKMFFVRYGKQDKWRLLITTDLSLSFVKTFEIYQIPWTTEVLYKEGRQYLRFGLPAEQHIASWVSDRNKRYVCIDNII